jgi:hypothetical protein
MVSNEITVSTLESGTAESRQASSRMKRVLWATRYLASAIEIASPLISIPR